MEPIDQDVRDERDWELSDEELTNALARFCMSPGPPGVRNDFSP